MAPGNLHRYWTLVKVIFSLCAVTALGATETEILIKFKGSLTNADAALTDWDPLTVPCKGEQANWKGIICSIDGKVWGLQLENMGLSGNLNFDNLLGLPSLRTLSFMYNNFEGPMPHVKKLTALKNLYISHNKFSGDIPDDAFDGMVWLKKFYASQNGFTGSIPSSLTKLPKLLELRLDDNQFRGRLPDFPQDGLLWVNVTNNHLEGRIPKHLSKLDSTLVDGNELCGSPLAPCIGNKKASPLIIAIIAIVVCAILLFIIYLIVILYRRQQQKAAQRAQYRSKTQKISQEEVKESSPEAYTTGKKSDNGKLSFVMNDRERFDLNDLLRASAEILGSGTFGSSYKAALLTGPVMVVKRFRHMNNAGREDFHEHMRRIGRLKHPNILSLVAYLYKKEEKLLISDFVAYGSLAAHLHGNRTAGAPGLDWPTRLNIVKGIAKGLTYLYHELPSLTVVHGHLKSTNVLLNESFEPVLMDYCLLPVTSKDHAVQSLVAYKSPEYAEYGRLSNKTDVWSLGILILEILTGKIPENYLTSSSANPDLASWVNSVVREEWTGEVFDKDLRGNKSGEGEMLKLLKIGLSCCERDIDKRWDLKEAVEKIEELKEKNNDSDDYSSYASEGDVYSSRAVTDDDFSFSMNASR